MWEKTGRILDPKRYGQTHAQMPIPLLLDGRLRVYYSTRDGEGCSYGVYADFHPDSLELLEAHTDPIIAKGEVGAFDDCGAMPSSILRDGDGYKLYYVGWNKCPVVRYRLAIGVASSLDLDAPFVKVLKGPIMDRSVNDPYWVGSPYVVKTGSEYAMWYISCTGWREYHGMQEPGYDIRSAISKDGVYWRSEGISLKHRYAAARACVLYHDGMYKMWYSHRGLEDYRTDPAAAYQIGLATSFDGYNWKIREPEIWLSDDGWDSEMMCYPYVYLHDGELHMLYNGNGFGATGIGHATWI